MFGCSKESSLQTGNTRFNIGITHVFSCINICRVPRMMFEHEADRPSVQHHPRDQASVNAMKKTCVIVILAYSNYLIPAQFTLKTQLKHLIVHFLTLEWCQLCTFECHNVVKTSLPYATFSATLAK